MSVGVDEPRQGYFARTIDFDQPLSILLDPKIVQGLMSRAGRNNLSADAEHCRIFDDSKLTEFWTASWSRVAGARPQSKKLPNI